MSVEDSLGDASRQMSVDEYVGFRLHVARLEKGVSRTALAELTGISAHILEGFEAGTRRIGVSRLMRLCATLEKGLSYFFLGRK